METFDISKFWYVWILFVVYIFDNPINSEVLNITNDNFNDTVASNELVLINFNTEWCQISKLIAPIYKEASDLVDDAFPDIGTVAFGNVNCDRNIELANRFHIRKYPTIIVVLNGEICKGEYRGKRTANGLFRFVEGTLQDPILEYKTKDDLQKFTLKRHKVIAYFVERNQPEYDVYRKVATNFRKVCQFYVGYGNVTASWHPIGKSNIVFRQDIAVSNEHDETFVGNLQNIDELKIWVEGRCKRLVNEIKLDNVNDFIAQGLPILILFYHPTSLSIIQDYKDLIEEQFVDEKDKIIFAFANGKHFIYSLNLFTKFTNDLPLIGINSRHHIFFFRRYADMYLPNLLKKFLQDFFSGKLLMEYYYKRNGHNSSEEFKKMYKDAL